jgi:hypothetical protein
MSDVLPWLEYRWTFDFPTGMYRAILARLAGAPARLEDLLREVPAADLARQPGGKWSALEHAGHLTILDEELHHPRIQQYLRGESALLAADMSNRATREHGFNQQAASEVLAGFRRARAVLLATLDPLTLADAARVALHPRLQRQLRLVDLCYFCAEHDDHHLAAIRSLLR